ncbi:MAG: (Na+)-NQR maturation NqrM [Candidatus Hydrogenedentes bacterium]|nr:(Na+)-NQR maturation NqrM [Candidatus Hydrogenedentota bacterium]
MGLLTVVLTVVIVAATMLIMAVGVMFRGKCLRGSCGGEDAVGPDGEILTCDTCPRRKEREREQASLAAMSDDERRECSLTHR